MTAHAAVLRVPSEAHPSVASAVAAAPVGATVMLAAGVFREPTLRLARSISLVGSGSEQSVIECEAATALVCSANDVRLTDLCIRQVLVVARSRRTRKDLTLPDPPSGSQAGSTSQAAFAVEVRGELAIDRCVLTAQSGAKLSAAVLARGAGAVLRLRACTLCGCGHAGLTLANGGRAHVDGGEICHCAGPGVLLLAGGGMEAAVRAWPQPPRCCVL
jgi:hypothetical protein